MMNYSTFQFVMDCFYTGFNDLWHAIFRMFSNTPSSFYALLTSLWALKYTNDTFHKQQPCLSGNLIIIVGNDKYNQTIITTQIEELEGYSAIGRVSIKGRFVRKDTGIPESEFQHFICDKEINSPNLDKIYCGEKIWNFGPKQTINSWFSLPDKIGVDLSAGRRYDYDPPLGHYHHYNLKYEILLIIQYANEKNQNYSRRTIKHRFFLKANKHNRLEIPAHPVSWDKEPKDPSWNDFDEILNN